MINRKTICFDMVEDDSENSIAEEKEVDISDRPRQENKGMVVEKYRPVLSNKTYEVKNSPL